MGIIYVIGIILMIASFFAWAVYIMNNSDDTAFETGEMILRVVGLFFGWVIIFFTFGLIGNFLFK